MLYMLLVIVFTNHFIFTQPSSLQFPLERHQIRVFDQTNNRVAGIIDFDVYRSRKSTYARGGAYYVHPDYKGLVPMGAIFKQWRSKLPELGIQKGYWRADPFILDSHGKYHFYHNDAESYHKKLQQLVQLYCAAGGIPETDAEGKIVQNGSSTSKGMKSVNFHYVVPTPVTQQPISWIKRFRALIGLRTIHTVVINRH